MGIKDLNKLIQKFAPLAMVPCQLSDLTGKTLAIDAYGMLHAYKVVHGTPSKYLDKLYDFCGRLRQHQIDAIIVMDGKNNIPGQHKPDKHAARAERDKRAISARNRLTVRQNELGLVKAAHEKFTEQVDTSNVQSMTAEQQEQLQALITQITTQEESVDSVKKQLISVTDEDVEATKTLFQVLGFGVATAEHEGEAGCVQLVLRGAADIVVSNDTDSLCFGDVKVLQNITSPNSMRIVDAVKVREEMGFTREEFVDMCILCGCDFSAKLKGLASQGAYREIKQHRNIEAVVANCPKYSVPAEGWTIQAARHTFLSMPCHVNVEEGVRDPDKLKALFARYQIDRELTDEENNQINKTVAQRKIAFNQPSIASFLRVVKPKPSTTDSASPLPEQQIVVESQAAENAIIQVLNAPTAIVDLDAQAQTPMEPIILTEAESTID